MMILIWKTLLHASLTSILFCTTYLDNGRNASAAYRTAYGNNKPEAHINSSASRLLRNDKVRSYFVKVAQDRLATTERKQDITRDFLIQQYLELVALGKEYKQISSARQALDSLAHVAGLWIDQREIKANIAIDANLNSLDTGQLLEALQQAKQPDAIEGEYKTVD